MNSLWSLVGYSQATWQITADFHQNPISYRLLPTSDSRELPHRLERETEQDTLKLVQTFLRIQAVKPSERQTYTHQLALDMLLDEDTIAAQFLQDDPNLNAFWAEVSLFATELSPEQLNQVLHGVVISLPLSSLKPANQEIARAFAGPSDAIINGVHTEIVPDTVRFYRTQYLGRKKHMMNNLCLSVGTQGQFKSCDFLAAMEIGITTRLYNRWILPGDLRTCEIEKKTVNALPTPMDGSLWRNAPPFDLLLTQFADALKVSYIAVVPEKPGSETVISSGRSAERCFTDLRSRLDIMHKWRNGVLLFNYPVWFYGDDAQYPYAIVKQLRESRRVRQEEPLKLSDIANLDFSQFLSEIAVDGDCLDLLG